MLHEDTLFTTFMHMCLNFKGSYSGLFSMLTITYISGYLSPPGQVTHISINNGTPLAMVWCLLGDNPLRKPMQFYSKLVA